MPLYNLKLLNRYTSSRTTFILEFEKPEGFTFIPGQYGGFTLINPTEKDAGGITRRFSILSTPDDPYIAIATRMQNSAYKKELHELKIGSLIKFAGPTGNFILHDDSTKPAVFIAGGIGITPFYSMVHFATKNQNNQQLYLFYGNETQDDSAFLEELTHLSHLNPNFKLILTMLKPDNTWQGEKGYITGPLIKKYLPNLDSPIFYICGSPAMVTALQEILVEMNISEDRIKVEDFPGYVGGNPC